MPFGLGFFATAGVSAAAGSFDLLETQVLSTATSSVTFSSLSTYSSYQHLQIRFAGTQVDVGGLDAMRLRINGDTGSNYNRHSLTGVNSTVSSASQGTNNYPYVGLMAGKGTPESGAIVMDFLDAFETSKNKVVRALGGAAGTGDKGVGLYSVLWMNTAAISSITLAGVTGNLATGSRFSLYGIKAA